MHSLIKGVGVDNGAIASKLIVSRAGVYADARGGNMLDMSDRGISFEESVPSGVWAFCE